MITTCTSQPSRAAINARTWAGVAGASASCVSTARSVAISAYRAGEFVDDPARVRRHRLTVHDLAQRGDDLIVLAPPRQRERDPLRRQRVGGL